MSALGIIVLIIFAILMLRGWIHGLLRMVLSVLVIVVVMVLVTVATPHVRDFVKENTNIYTAIQEKSSGVLQDRVENSLEASAGENGSEEELDIGLPQQITGYLIDSGESMIEESGIYETVGEKVANWTVTGVCYLVMFGIGMIVVVIVKHLTKRANKVPVLGKINRLLGLVLGFGEGYLVVCVVFLFIALASGSELGGTCTDTIRDNGFLTFLYQHNVILNFLSLE